MPPASLLSPEGLDLLLKKAASTPAGAFLEVGVWRGGSAWHLAKLASEQFRLCLLADTFKGIPYEGPRDNHKAGDFHQTSLAEVRAAIPFHALYIEGIFPQSVEKWLDFPSLAFVHLDCDQEQSYRESLAWVWPHLVSGGVIWCDDADCIPGAGFAVDEFVKANPSAMIDKNGKWKLEKP